MSNLCNFNHNFIKIIVHNLQALAQKRKRKDGHVGARLSTSKIESNNAFFKLLKRK